jgi:hypothetical protein
MTKMPSGLASLLAIFARNFTAATPTDAGNDSSSRIRLRIATATSYGVS